MTIVKIYKSTSFELSMIQMSHWHHTMVDGVDFWISCQRLRFLKIVSSALSTILCCQYVRAKDPWDMFCYISFVVISHFLKQHKTDFINYFKNQVAVWDIYRLGRFCNFQYHNQILNKKQMKPKFWDEFKSFPSFKWQPLFIPQLPLLCFCSMNSNYIC